MKRVILGLALFFAVTAPANAGFDGGVAAFKGGDFAAAYRELLPFAEQGNAEAQTNIGFLYAQGQGVAQDYAEAVKWVRLTAAQGYAKAQFLLGFMYENGHGVARDYAEAVKWVRLAATRTPAQGTETRDMAVRNRDNVAKKMTLAQIEEAKKLAHEWNPE